ncbi:MAG: hypothetical protein A3H98_00415 [Bacteroidetes bacterium RIFCSPLOWO2_02_FULL_36_8]|nr:MAG: hypothetical protein A3H98_00415 [Bacteroidetes bacterium RIFCSPLOWO2_02_FULL_36_8]OFY71102.1 MAG: hypothetical protein A3G23_14935 [Bacteroidetes bacterium RIFCSPLOWO2_12_FULL_37_12]
MYYIKYIFLPFLIFAGLVEFRTYSQDMHFSQSGNVPLFINPATAGVMDGDYRLNVANRSQWASITVPYTTYLAGFDLKVPAKRKKPYYIGTGIIGYADKAGDGNFGISGIQLALNYTRTINQFGNSEVSIAFMTGVNQMGFDATKFYFDRQFSGDQYVPESFSGETFNSTIKNGFDRSLGLRWKMKTGKKSHIETGLCWYHIFLSPSGFYTLKPWSNPSRFSFYIAPEINISDKTNLFTGIYFQSQSNHREILAGADINAQIGSSTFHFISGVWVRIKDAIILDCGIQYKKLKVTFSYDINFSDLNTVSNYQGGPEITLIYIFRKPHAAAVPQTTCPVYY